MQVDNQEGNGRGTVLRTTVDVRVRFCEVDSIRMVWHGSYVKYLEDAREEFGRRFGLAYTTYLREGLLAPVVDMHISYKGMATIDDMLRVEITYHRCRGSKLMFDYTITRPADGTLIATAETTQLFTDLNGTLIASTPDFIEQWRAAHGL